MHVTVDPFVPAQAGEQDLMGYYNVTAAVFLEANPDTPLPTFEAVAAVLRAPDEPIMRRRFWIARDDNQSIVGLVIVNLPSAENAESVIAQVRVLPTARRQGVGRALLRAMLSDATLTAGRSRLVGMDVVGGSEGDRWAAGLGFKRTQERVLQVLPVSELDPARWDIPFPDGFSWQAWAGAAPEHLVADYALARSAMADAPAGRSSLRAPEWTVERVRERERFERESGRDLWVVAALDVASGRIVGLTEMIGYPEQAAVTFQQDTVVVAEFRGKGLGRAMKAAMMRGLLAERPRLERVETGTAADNKYMIKVNHDLGYITTQTMATIEAEITVVRSRLAARAF